LSFQHVRLKTVLINERANAETVPKSDRRQNLGERGMKVPNAEQAIVEIAKLRDYSLDSTHKEGKHKARVFAAALEITEGDADWLRSVLLEAVRRYDCELGRKTSFGQRYIVDFPIVRDEKRARVRSVWNVRPGEIVPRLITCYVL
jgi:hypothetical protein